MSKAVLRNAALATLVVALSALPSDAQVIKKGKDLWVTPANGQTLFTFPKGDVEALCGAQAAADPITVTLKGNPAFLGTPDTVAGADYDTVVARLDDAVFNGNTASTRIQVVALQFVSAANVNTPCGNLSFNVGLAGSQAVTVMKLTKTSARGGTFTADISVNVEFQAFKNGIYIGSLFYNRILPNPANGTGWSFGPNGQFRAGLTETEDCIDVLRAKLQTPFGQDPQHFYYISQLIANKDCGKRPA